MTVALQRKFIKALQSNNQQVISDILSNPEFITYDTNIQYWLGSPDHTEPLYSYIAYSLYNTKNEEDLFFYKEHFLKITSIDPEHLNKQSTSIKKPFITDLSRRLTRPALYNQEVYQKLSHSKYINNYSEDLFLFITQQLIDLSYKPSEYNNSDNPMNMALKRNHPVADLFINHHIENDIPFNTYFYTSYFQNKKRNDDTNFTFIESLFENKPHFFEHIEAGYLNLFQNFYQYNPFAVWLYEKNKKNHSVVMNNDDNREELKSLLPSLLTECVAQNFNNSDPFFDFEMIFNKIFSDNNFSNIMNLPLFKNRQFDQIYMDINNDFIPKTPITITDFMFKLLPLKFRRTPSFELLYDSFFQHLPKESIYNETNKYSPMEHLVVMAQLKSQSYYHIPDIINLFSKYPACFEKNIKDGKNMWHYVRTTNYISEFEKMIPFGCSLDNIDNLGNHAFTEIIYNAVNNDTINLIQWCADKLKNHQIENLKGTYNGVELKNIIKLNATLTKIFKEDLNEDIELNTACKNLKIIEVLSLLKINQNIVNNINNDNETPFLTLLKSPAYSTYKIQKQEKIYNILKKYDLDTSVLIEGETALNKYFQYFLENDHKTEFNYYKNLFMSKVINQTEAINSVYLSKYLSSHFHKLCFMHNNCSTENTKQFFSNYHNLTDQNKNDILNNLITPQEGNSMSLYNPMILNFLLINPNLLTNKKNEEIIKIKDIIYKHTTELNMLNNKDHKNLITLLDKQILNNDFSISSVTTSTLKNKKRL